MYRFLTSIVVLITIFTSHADSTIDRKGFTAGIAAGGGILIVNDIHKESASYGRMSLLNMKFGYMLTPNTEICLHIPSGGHREAGEERAFEAVLAGGQHWFTNALWGRIAAGMAMDMPPFYETENEDPDMYFGFAMCMGAGYELFRKGGCALDIQARYLYGRYTVEGVLRQSSAIDILVGCTWY